MKNKKLLVIIAIAVFVIGSISIALILSDKTPQDAAESVESAQQLLDEGDFTGAKSELEKLIETNTDNAEAHFLLGLALFNLEEYSEARVHFEQAMALEPARASAVHHNLGVLAFQLGDMETALDEFQQALAEDPNDPDSHYQLGATYLVLAYPMGATAPDPDLLTQAEEQFELSLNVSPDKPEALVGLANIYMLSNDLTKAIELLERAVKAQPNMREALFALGRAYAFSGNLTDAKSTLEQFLDTSPPAQWRQQAEELLSQLE